ncbi:threonine synthase [Flammeovirga yaeyamensis]|uniref:Threonine synthase n=2 Tax=Flammeovirga yaeyamensis TaxID=367791 RepID=A0AAX1N2A2_9BACT|nr:threonine synthase [Flammeovirga yaeyamensis]NMF38476.1 threonine synthase [Flammeovirga yaeyamensis]QWG01664.1 threonine synthase [Flammeovirga yaeyamensis]
MIYYSTKRQAEEASLKKALFKGLPEDNGLYMPEKIAKLPQEFFDNIEKLSFQDIAYEVTNALLSEDVPSEEIRKIVDDAVNFDAPIVKVVDQIYSLELFHGPTLAFKDFGARFMARLMSYFLDKGEKLHILVATSGDTGSAVAQGFFGVEGIQVTILYPKGKVSPIQEQQLTTNGGNIKAVEIEGTFDDCQRLVKEAFLDKELAETLNLTSANSINISRLIPQSFYYFNAFAQLKREGFKKVIFCTPSGNFGNLCGGMIANRMGLKVEHFIAATNANKVVPVYLRTEIFQPRPSLATISNAMDVGNPSNFPRLLELHNNDFETLKERVTGTYFTDEETRDTMKEVYDQTKYILCPHSAIGYQALKDYMDKEEIGKKTAGVFLSTAHPVKFVEIVEPVINKKLEIPQRLQEIIDRPKKATLLEADFKKFKKYLLAEVTATV